MKQAYLITEDKPDVEIIKKLLPKSIVRSIEVVAVGAGSDHVVGWANTLLMTKQLPVAAVIKTHTLNETMIQERIDLLRYLVVRPADIRFEIFPAVPEIETVFFQDRRFIERLANRSFTEMEWKFAKLHPKEALTYLLGNSVPLNKKILDKLTDENIRVLQTHPLIVKLSDFLSSVVESQKLAKAA